MNTSVRSPEITASGGARGARGVLGIQGFHRPGLGQRSLHRWPDGARGGPDEPRKSSHPGNNRSQGVVDPCCPKDTPLIFEVQESVDLHNSVYILDEVLMSPKQRFQILLESEQLAALRRIEERVGVPIARQVRMAVDRWLEAQGEKTERKRASTRKRP